MPCGFAISVLVEGLSHDTSETYYFFCNVEQSCISFLVASLSCVILSNPFPHNANKFPD